MPEILFDGNTFTYKLKSCNRRKTIQLKLTAYDQIEISVPAGARNLNIEKMLFEKANWIISQSARLKTLSEISINSSIVDGAELLFLGKTYTLQVIKQETMPSYIELLDDNILLNITSSLDRNNSINAVLMNWYTKKAAQVLEDRTHYWSKLLAVNPLKLNLKDQKTRWGSCSSRGTINYNWRIIMAPPDVIDYLVIHELSHLIFPNHSQKFWQVVAKHCPYFQEHRAWLKNNGQLLMRLFK